MFNRTPILLISTPSFWEFKNTQLRHEILIRYHGNQYLIRL